MPVVEVFSEAGDPLLMALFQGDGDGARQLPPWRVEDVVELLSFQTSWLLKATPTPQ